MKTEKCKNCGKRFRLHEWQNPFEKKWCFTCRVKLKVIFSQFLGKKENEILCMKLGLVGDYKMKSLAEIAKHFGVTKERVRQIESKSLEILVRKGGVYLWEVGEYKKFLE